MKQVITMLASVCLSVQVLAQYSLQGTVTDVENEPLPGAHVLLQQTYLQTTTDSKGSFVFSGIKGNYTLRVSYVGYETAELKLAITGNEVLTLVLKESAVISDAVIVSAVRANHNTPTTFTTLSKEEIGRKNLGQDLPYLLGKEPSVVATSDAGTGVGYTGLRIRGSDITRINVTINGIPLNDPESHAVYWVDIPDFASSVNSLQLQRGVGSSTNGAGAFGASMNLETNTIQSKPFGAAEASFGSFNTWKTSFQAGTGLIKDHWYFEGRASAIGSEGYIDRASAALKSYFLQGGYRDDKTLIKAIAFGGNEKTYQAWYGIDAGTMKTNRTFNWAGAVFEEDGSMWFYDNQTDNYRQNHYQVHITRQLARNISMNLAGHYTRGRGYYEEYRQDETFDDYGLPTLYFGKDSIEVAGSYQYFYNDSVTSTDLIRRRWLDNHYYGLTWSLKGDFKNTELIVGGAWNKYDRARHYGEVIWAEFASESRPGDKYYDNSAEKADVNLFAKVAWKPVKFLTLYGDMQYRYIDYSVIGIESHLQPVDIEKYFHFANPKAGISYETRAGSLYASYSIAHREPIRDDYIDAAAGEEPEPETLGNLEIGIRKTDPGYHYSFNYYLMNYMNQLVLTGAINDDGAYIRKNAGKSYRTGIELSGGFRFHSFLTFDGNLSLSSNKTDYRMSNDEGEIIEYKGSDISFSPRITGGGQVGIFPVKNMEVAWMLQYVGRQFLDNTGNKALQLDEYLVNNLLFSYLLPASKRPGIEFSLLINNLLNNFYESNGYVYDNEPYYYPQAGVNFLAGVRVRL
jgi:iron complex outermembrane receptor protein